MFRFLLLFGLGLGLLVVAVIGWYTSAGYRRNRRLRGEKRRRHRRR